MSVTKASKHLCYKSQVSLLTLQIAQSIRLMPFVVNTATDFQSNPRLNLFNPSLWIHTWNTYTDKIVSVQTSIFFKLSRALVCVEERIGLNWNINVMLYWFLRWNPLELAPLQWGSEVRASWRWYKFSDSSGGCLLEPDLFGWAKISLPNHLSVTPRTDVYGWLQQRSTVD